MSATAYYIVEEQALPEVIRKVAQAKHLLETGEAAAVSQAVRRVGISRSAFYKYRDAVHPFNNLLSGRIITFQALLYDRPGVLSSLLAAFAGSGANILTIHQSIPSGGCALVTVSAETSQLRGEPEALLHTVRDAEGVVRAEILAG